ncbi:mevalonate kinase [uncultured Methanobrevibacter sp.]|uniref:mevalonate kinase n=1 Tax=uncultured Methanobrevibacter sp. TaxID=253161 RepID=UPI0025ECC3E0|nr:mevalonate kinase [uncultured Methanobrevibacter sp.]
MEVIASAPGKTILFGEHAVVYSQPAAVSKRATIRIKDSSSNKTILKSADLGFEAELDTQNKEYVLKKGKPGIIRYILEALHRAHNHSPIEITLSIDIPIGSGLGSSAAVTVATLAALHRYHNIYFNKKYLAEMAHQVEFSVQGEASPLDTLISTYGGLIYLDRNKKLHRINAHIDAPFVIGVTSKYGSTSKMVRNVKILKNKFPKVMNPIIETMGVLTDGAKSAIEEGDINKIGELMNINHGFLDAIGVNTKELSRMVYIARVSGAIGSKITGAGGGGSIIALCPDKVNEVSDAIGMYDSTITLNFSRRGVSSRIINDKNISNFPRKNRRSNGRNNYKKQVSSGKFINHNSKKIKSTNKKNSLSKKVIQNNNIKMTNTNKSLNSDLNKSNKKSINIINSDNNKSKIRNNITGNNKVVYKNNNQNNNKRNSKTYNKNKNQDNKKTNRYHPIKNNRRDYAN